MSIALSLGNNLTTGGVFKPTAVNNTSCNNVTSFAGISGGGTLILLSTQTASASASINFTSGIDSTYDEYIFKFINCHPASEGNWQFNGSIDGGSNYNVTKTTTLIRSYHNEADGSTGLSYIASDDIANGTGYMNLQENNQYTDNDNHCSGYLHIFQPSSTTYMKHFYARSMSMKFSGGENYCLDSYVGGYFNTTSAINAISFLYSSGNTDDGIIKMYGLVKS